MNTKPDVFGISRRDHTCPKCKAKPGEMCVLTAGYAKGRIALTLHNERLRAAGFGNAIENKHMTKIKIRAVTLERLRKYSIHDGITWSEPDDRGMVEIELTYSAIIGLGRLQDADDKGYDYLINELIDITEEFIQPKRLN